MRTRDEEMTGLTHKLECECERISPEDLADALSVIDFIEKLDCRTYDLFITSDTVTDSEETQS